MGCARNKVSEIPNAPPPYPDYPVPQSYFDPAVNPYQPTQTTPVSVDPGNYQLEDSYTNYSPPPNSNFYPPQPVSASGPSTFIPEMPTNPVEKARFSLHAHANLWALVQNEKGVELEWLKMKAGEKASLTHNGRLTITCSSGKDLEIFNARGDKIMTKPNPSGISIIRL